MKAHSCILKITEFTVDPYTEPGLMTYQTVLADIAKSNDTCITGPWTVGGGGGGGTHVEFKK